MSFRHLQKAATSSAKTVFNTQKRKLHVPKVETADQLNKTLKNEKIFSYGTAIFCATLGLYMVWESEAPGSNAYVFHMFDEKPGYLRRPQNRAMWKCTKCGIFERECAKACKKEEQEKKEAYQKLVAAGKL